MGQVCSESIGLRQISAVGGQVDFVRGVALTPDGISIIATPSTTKDGKTSKIVPFLDEGATVTTNRFDVQNIVTEYGIANLHNVTLRERSRRLINIAHPDFRPMLIEEYERRYKQKFQK
jgi:4-hydroxybutyrate CoA-transferase